MIFFWSGWRYLALALVSPLHPLGEALFSAHMAQHEILILVAGPLLVLSRPLVPMLWGMPLEWRKSVAALVKVARGSRHLVVVYRSVGSVVDSRDRVVGLARARLFQATLGNEWIHTAQHLSFFLSALLFWWALFHARCRIYGASRFYVFTTAVHTSILGALLTFAPRFCIRLTPGLCRCGG